MFPLSSTNFVHFLPFLFFPIPLKLLIVLQNFLRSPSNLSNLFLTKFSLAEFSSFLTSFFLSLKRFQLSTVLSFFAFLKK